MPPVPRFRAFGGHLVICGDDTLTFRVAEELTARYQGLVTVILPSRRRNHGPDIDRLRGVRVIERAETDSQAFADAQIRSARALALLRQDDIGNFHAALRARELNPDLRLVLAIFSPGLGERVQALFPDCAVLVGTSMSAPSFVAAALGEPAASHVRVSGRTLYVAQRQHADPARTLCGLAAISGSGEPRLLPPDQQNADLVLAIADGTPRDALTRRRSPLRAAARTARHLLWHKFGFALAGLLAALVTGFSLLAAGAHYTWSTALYLTLLDTAGAAVTSPVPGQAERVAQFLLTFDGLVFVPFATAVVVGARLTGSLRDRRPPAGGHVIVVGLGTAGTRVLGQLHDLGHDVVCIDQDQEAPGVSLARRLGMPVITGDIRREETLHAANLRTSAAFVSVTSKDEVNLEAALHARALREDLRIVLRLYDDDLAERVQKMIGNTVSRSVAYLAAPAFAAAMLEHQVLRTIPVGRHVLLIAEVEVEPGAELCGQPVDHADRPGQARVIAVQPRAAGGFDWSMQRDYILGAQDRLLVLATRAGLAQTLARNQRPAPLFQLSTGLLPVTSQAAPGTGEFPPLTAGRPRRTGVNKAAPGLAEQGPERLRSVLFFHLVLLIQM